MTMLDYFRKWDQEGLLPLMEKCYHPQQRVTPVFNYYIARDWYEATQKEDYNLYDTLLMLEKKYRLNKSRLYAIRKAFSAEVRQMQSADYKR